MSIRSKDLVDFRLPRWEEFPAFELYIDQVIAFINESLWVFKQDEESIMTPSMINNYVKNGILPAPVKKKYNREHLAKLVVLCMGKRMLSIADLKDSIAVMSRAFSVSDGYNLLCDEVEYEIKSSVCPQDFPPRWVQAAQSRQVSTMRALAAAVAKILVFDCLMGQRRRLGVVVSKLNNQ